MVVAIDGWRSVRLLAFCAGVALAADLPDFFAGGFIQREDRGSPAVDQLQIESLAVEDRSRRHAELDVEAAVLLLQIDPPDFLTIEIEAGENSIPGHHPDMMSIGRRRRGRRVAFVATDVLVAGAEDLSPENLAGSVGRQKDEVLAIGRGQKNVVVPDHGRGAGRSRQRQSPGDILAGLFAPLRWQACVAANTIESRAAPLGPVFALGGRGIGRFYAERHCANNRNADNGAKGEEQRTNKRWTFIDANLSAGGRQRWELFGRVPHNCRGTRYRVRSPDPTSVATAPPAVKVVDSAPVKIRNLAQWRAPRYPGRFRKQR